ncbi:hypothetical protein ACFL35_10300 [Candidatus Riflebacteria bacterium]
MFYYYVDLFSEVKLPWNSNLDDCLKTLDESGFPNIENGPDYVICEHDFDDYNYEIFLSFPGSAHFTLRSAILRLRNSQEDISRTKNTIKNFRYAFRKLYKKFGEPLEINDFDQDEAPVEILQNLRDENYPEVIWENKETRILLEIEEADPYQAVIRHYCQLPVRAPEKKKSPLDILSLVKDLDIKLDSNKRNPE